MGKSFSKEPGHFQLLAKEPNGQLHVYTTSQTDQLKDCTKLPFEMQENVGYAFISTSDKKWNPHVYADDICDVTGNEQLTPYTPWANKSVTTIKYTNDSNSNYFQMTNEDINTPRFGKFYDKNGDGGISARKSSLNRCVPLPMNSMPKIGGQSNNIKYDRNTVAMAFYTDASCNNEYISNIPIEPGKTFLDNRRYNYNNRALNPELLPLPYTDVKAIEYAAPSDKTNAKYYKSYRPDYPTEISS